MIVHVEFAHLFLQLVVERHALAIDDLLTFLSHRTASMINGQFIVVAPHITEGIVEGRLALFTLTARLEVVCLAIILMIGIVLVFWLVSTIKRRICLKGRIVIHLRRDTVHQLRDGQLYQRCL